MKVGQSGRCRAASSRLRGNFMPFLKQGFALAIQYGFACLLLLVLTGLSHATSISLPMTQEFSGATPPAGASPWLTPKFDDENTPGTVKLVIETTNLTGSEKVSGVYLNVDPLIDPTTLSFSAPTKTGTFVDPVISLGTDAFMADGDGKYDILLTFDTSSGNEFGAGEDVEYTISLAGLEAGDFAFLSNPAGGHGPFYAAAHVQGIGAGGGDSGWISPEPGIDPFEIPEPSSMAIMLLGLLAGMTGMRRHK